MKRARLYLLGIAVIALLLVAWLGYTKRHELISQAVKPFDGQRAYADVETQMSFGPRVVGTAAHQKARDWMVADLKKSGWNVDVQTTSRLDHPVENVIAKRGSGTPWIILGAHYDSRMIADQDPNPSKRSQPVPGANDGASGVAVLLELARTLPTRLVGQIWLVMVDTEDNGDIPGWDWLLGSRAFVDSLNAKPTAAVIIDMIGDANLDIYQERNSTKALIDQIWKQASDLGYSKAFIPSYKYSMIDDHTPFLEAGIPAIDIIDFDYPPWHTTQDTADKVSAGSLKTVGDTLSAWLIDQVGPK